RQYGITREEQDAFAAASQQRAGCAMKEGLLQDEIVPVTIARRKGAPIVVDADEHPRPARTIQKLAMLKPAFTTDPDGSVTAGNSSGINDGSSGLVPVGREALNGVGPPARNVSTAVVGVDPSMMGIAPTPATRKALQRAGLTIDDIDLIEL